MCGVWNTIDPFFFCFCIQETDRGSGIYSLFMVEYARQFDFVFFALHVRRTSTYEYVRVRNTRLLTWVPRVSQGRRTSYVAMSLVG